MGANQSTGTPNKPPDAAAVAAPRGRIPAAKAPDNVVKFAVSVIGGAGPVSAYHSSVIINGEEFSFSDAGISVMSNIASHQNVPEGANTQVIDMGFSAYNATKLKAALEPFFLPGTYDMLRKNCNSFSDCAIWYLLRKRIDKKYRAIEKLGSSVQNLVASASEYTPNKKADGFDVEKICLQLDPEKVWSTPGQATGGSTVQSPAEMRAARLARFAEASGSSGGPSKPVSNPALVASSSGPNPTPTSGGPSKLVSNLVPVEASGGPNPASTSNAPVGPSTNPI